MQNEDIQDEIWKAILLGSRIFDEPTDEARAFVATWLLGTPASEAGQAEPLTREDIINAEPAEWAGLKKFLPVVGEIAAYNAVQRLKHSAMHGYKTNPRGLDLDDIMVGESVLRAVSNTRLC